MFKNPSPFDRCFPNAETYRPHASEPALMESAAPFNPFPYRERHLQCLWADPRHRPERLQTTDGECVEVEYAGDWNLEAGPDFLNAVLRIGRGQRRICGDLEVHIHAGAWKQHGHAEDPRYRNVRFHLVYFQGMEIPGLLQIPLQEPLAADPRFSFENIDLAAYPYALPLGPHPLQQMDPDAKIRWLESAGEERLRTKAERFVFALQRREPEQLLWEELMAALGYKNNKYPFRRLAVLMPVARLRSLTGSPTEAYAVLLGLSGLMPTRPDPAWPINTRRFIRSLWDVWWKQSGDLRAQQLSRTLWVPAGIRPTNHPVRRLMAAAHYAFDLNGIGLNDRRLTEFPDTFWTTHLGWSRCCEPVALVGTARAHAMVTNILVPWRAAMGLTDLRLDRLPVEPLNRIIRQTAHLLFGPDHTPKVYRSALARQGLIQIFHDYVVTHRLDELMPASALPGVEPHAPDNMPTGGTMSSSSGQARHAAAPTADNGDVVPPATGRPKTGGTMSSSSDQRFPA